VKHGLRHLPRGVCTQVALLAFLLLVYLGSAKGAEPYALGPGDVVDIQVGDEPSMSGIFKISEEGTIVYPLLGALKVSGLDVGSLGQTIRERLAKDYIVNPQVAVYVSSYGSSKVSVRGDLVSSPGVFPLRAETTLLSVLTEAGFKATDSDVTIVIRHREAAAEKGQKAAETPPRVLNLSNLTSARNSGEPVPLRDGDQIFVVAKKVSVFGDMLGSPGVYFLKADTTLLTLLTEAGFKATDSDVAIVIRHRETAAEKGQKAVDPPPTVLSLSSLTSARKTGEPVVLQDGDQIFVVAKKVSVLGDMLGSPGVYSLKADTTILTLLAGAGFKATDSEVTIVIRHRETAAEQGQKAVEPPPTVLSLSRLTSAWEDSEPVALQDGDQVFVVAKVRGKVVLSGKVKKPGNVPLSDGLTVWEALNNAGGAAEFGDLSAVRVIREAQGKTTVLQVDLTSVDKGTRSEDIPLKDGDIVVVPKRWF
jgi:polysaccharide export outer membrane protein